MKKALVLIDIQNDYFEGGSMELVGAKQASENAKLVLHKFRQQELPIVHIQHIAGKPEATFFIPNTVGAEIQANVTPLHNEKVIVKQYPNSFRDTALLDYLQSLNITDLVLCGMMTHMCIDATTRAAKDYGFTCTIIGDACATKDLELNGTTVHAIDVQTAFLAALNYFYATVINTKEYV